MTSNVASSSAQLQKQIQAKVNARTQSNPFVVDAPDDIETFRRQLLAEKEQEELKSDERKDNGPQSLKDLSAQRRKDKLGEALDQLAITTR
eukprot:gene2279-5273_t